MSTKTIHYQLCGLDYVYIRVPVAKSKGEEYINLPMGVIEKAIARQLISARVPIRGAELVFLRKTFGMTLKDLACPFRNKKYSNVKHRSSLFSVIGLPGGRGVSAQE